MNPHRMIGLCVRRGLIEITRSYLKKVPDIHGGSMTFTNSSYFTPIIQIRLHSARIFWWSFEDANYHKFQEYIKDEPA